jgi:Uncharacterized conserved protein
MNFWIGTSGFQYAEWKGNFYPEDLPPRRCCRFMRTIFNDGDQLHISPHSRAENNRQLESANAGEIPVCTEGAAENHALVEAARLRRHA